MAARRIKALVLLGAALALATLLIFFLYPASRPDDAFRPLSSSKPHYANDPSIALANITIKAVYFLPADKRDALEPTWQEALKKALNGLKTFYEFQLHQALTITYEIYPEPVVGTYERAHYDGSDTNRGNPGALKLVRLELLRRIFAPDGELYRKEFADFGRNEHAVIAILYEGVGASALMFTDGVSDVANTDVTVLEKGEVLAFLVSRFVLTGADFRDNGATLFSHEFGHTLGLPDGYDIATGQSTSDDIMGLGRLRPLTATYLDREAKEKLGIPY